MEVKVGKKGYIIIPKSIRTETGINEGDILTISVNDGIILKKNKKNKDLLKLMNALKDHELAMKKYKINKNSEKYALEDEFD